MSFAYDGLGRLAKRSLKGDAAKSYDTTYGYLPGGYGASSTTSMIGSITQPGHNYVYTYDTRGMITKELHNGVETHYTYDGMGQLTRVDDAHQDRTFFYFYDLGGNIKEKSEWMYQPGVPITEVKGFKGRINYGYEDRNWLDKLTSYDGVPIEYDAIGNPLNDGTWRYTWTSGRNLARMEKEGECVEFAYNASGLRVQKRSMTRGTTDYVLAGKQIVRMIRTPLASDPDQTPVELHFYYAGQESPTMVSYKNKCYWYVYNLQGDVVALLDKANNEEVVSYSYDAWGKQVSCTGVFAETLGGEQPFRYRGYLYDGEMGLYYLRSRYYNPHLHRFINTDDIIGDIGAILSHNVFSYCGNASVMLCDPNGTSAVAAHVQSLAPDLLELLKLSPYGVLGGLLLTLLLSAGSNTSSGADTHAQGKVEAGSATTRLIEDVLPSPSDTWGEYYFAFGLPGSDAVMKVGAAMSYEVAYAALVGFTLTDMSLSEFRGHISGLEGAGRELTGSSVIGIYTQHQDDAKLLAMAGGYINDPRVHGELVGHYHFSLGGKGRKIHIWFGSAIPYQ